MLKIKDAALLLKVDARRIRAAINSGELPALNVGRGSRPEWRIDEADFEAFVRGLKKPAKPERKTRRRKCPQYV